MQNNFTLPQFNFQRDTTCGICLEEKCQPIGLPCGHSFCAPCIHGWRDKYGLTAREKTEGRFVPDARDIQRGCPNCRQSIPPTRDMVASLNAFAAQKRNMERNTSVCSDEYKRIANKLDSLRKQVGEDWDGTTTLDDPEENQIELPVFIARCVPRNDTRRILGWLGDPTTQQCRDRVNARIPSHGNMALLHICQEEDNVDLASILLQRGADVEVKDSQAATMLVRNLAYGQGSFEACGKLALEWGATTTGHAIDVIEKLESDADPSFATLLKSEFGLRRCEIMGLGTRPDLNGKTCVVRGYLPETDEYDVAMEHSDETLILRRENLKRRDRTPGDPGYFVEFKKGKTTRRDFRSNEECQAFVASNAGVGDIDENAEAKAEQAALDLLAEFGLEDDTLQAKKTKTNDNVKSSKKKGGKKRRK